MNLGALRTPPPALGQAGDRLSAAASWSSSTRAGSIARSWRGRFWLRRDSRAAGQCPAGTGDRCAGSTLVAGEPFENLVRRRCPARTPESAGRGARSPPRARCRPCHGMPARTSRSHQPRSRLAEDRAGALDRSARIAESPKEDYAVRVDAARAFASAGGVLGRRGARIRLAARAARPDAAARIGRCRGGEARGGGTSRPSRRSHQPAARGGRGRSCRLRPAIAALPRRARRRQAGDGHRGGAADSRPQSIVDEDRSDGGGPRAPSRASSARRTRSRSIAGAVRFSRSRSTVSRPRRAVPIVSGSWRSTRRSAGAPGTWRGSRVSARRSINRARRRRGFPRG